MSSDAPVVLRAPGRNEKVAAWAVVLAYTGTIVIGAGAFWLSATTLADLAGLAGIPVERAWIWPGVVDGLIVIATVAVLVLRPHGVRAVVYPWFLLTSGTVVSVAANAFHAIAYAEDVRGLPVIAAAGISAVPPLVLLATTHLTVQLHERRRPPMVPAEAEPVVDRTPETVARPRARSRSRSPRARALRTEAQQLSADGASNRGIARQLEVHPSTVGRWLGPAASRPAHLPSTKGETDET